MLANLGVDLLLIWGSPALNALTVLCRYLTLRQTYSMCCKFEQLVLNAFEGLSSLSNARNGTNADVLPCV